MSTKSRIEKLEKIFKKRNETRCQYCHDKIQGVFPFEIKYCPMCGRELK